MLENYRQHVSERANQGVAPKPLDAAQVAGLCELLKHPPAGEESILLDLLENRIPAGVDEAAYVKAGFLFSVAKSDITSPILTPEHATKLLGTMLGGYNIAPLIELLDSDNTAICSIAAHGLSHTLLIFDAFHDVQAKANSGNTFAAQVLSLIHI